MEDILQLLKNRSSSDVRIITKDGEILANKVLLSTRCEYFATMFRNNQVKFIEGETNSVDMMSLQQGHHGEDSHLPIQWEDEAK